MKSFIVDAFSDQPFSGNPAAVVLQNRQLDDEYLQKIAAEFNLSETAFLQPLDSQGECWSLRWFTPKAEVSLCGHATLACAHALWEQCQVGAETLRFDTLSGELRVQRRGDGMSMDFPLCVTQSCSYNSWPASLTSGAVAAATAGEDLLLELTDQRAVENFTADSAAISALNVRGLIVTARGEQHDFVSRFFAPAVGIEEDPVTGSAHCALAHYWQQKLGRDTFQARQISARGGNVGIAIHSERVVLSGSARTVLAGELLV
ncbi:PhzF family phenazine biosynthesis protein [Spongiibacter marinus]|uniref:PhzF family phenazine biosynthesis protein n=1 Tax=Spongiibacter marinus TaxID=354246 RepID=UPI003C66F501